MCTVCSANISSDSSSEPTPAFAARCGALALRLPRQQRGPRLGGEARGGENAHLEGGILPHGDGVLPHALGGQADAVQRALAQAQRVRERHLARRRRRRPGRRGVRVAPRRRVAAGRVVALLLLLSRRVRARGRGVEGRVQGGRAEGRVGGRRVEQPVGVLVGAERLLRCAREPLVLRDLATVVVAFQKRVPVGVWLLDRTGRTVLLTAGADVEFASGGKVSMERHVVWRDRLRPSAAGELHLMRLEHVAGIKMTQASTQWIRGLRVC